MKVPLSWLKDYVEINLPLADLAHKLTMAGLEVEEIIYVGLPMPADETASGAGDRKRPETKLSGIEWAPDKIVVAAVHEVMPHPNADRLVLCRLEDGEREHIVLTGAPNLYPYTGQGALEKPLKVAYAREGARIFDGHQPGQALTTLKRTKIRGVESYSMICSEKELGISEAHEGVIILDDDAPVGAPLVDYMGDAVLDINITPNIARDANILGVAREVAAITGASLRPADFDCLAEGPSFEGKVTVEIRNPVINPRFVFGLIQDVKIGPSPYWVQRRLLLAGMRPINNLVDATNYVMLEVGEPLHAFDYDILARRAGGKAPAIYTRTAKPGERLVTLDDVERSLDDFTVLVCDQSGALALAGVMGGAESEINESTRNVLLEGAAWNMINTRRTILAQKLPSEAAYRFSRGVHPAMAPRGVRRGLEMMRRWAGGVIAQGLVDNYPLPAIDPTVEVAPRDVRRWLGIDLTPAQIADLLSRLEFKVEIDGESVRATAPDHRLDIGQGVIGLADVLEEIARIYGYENIPETRMADDLPPQRGNPSLEREERVRDLLVGLGLQEVVTYRMTSQEREARLVPPGAPLDERPYVKIANPIAVDRDVLRHSLVPGLLEVVERNARLRQRIALFEIGPVFLASPQGELPEESTMLALAISGPRAPAAWQGADSLPMDFYDLKGILQALFDGLHLAGARYEEGQAAPFHPGKRAQVLLGERQIGVFGELHPLARTRYELPETPLVAAELDLQALLEAIPVSYTVQPVPAYPPVLEDLALIVDEDTPAERLESLIREAGGKTLSAVRLFDVYRGEQIGAGKKSLAYSLVYQAEDRTLTDEQVLKIRQRIVRRLEQELGARLRS
ncbi:MAG: phenylalanine--tRNA ligase subunit beta [Anaerolineales bacterium]|nr:phenylalanine--tRNA ligase subunit beta [Anaerolineales bacterium]